MWYFHFSVTLSYAAYMDVPLSIYLAQALVKANNDQLIETGTTARTYETIIDVLLFVVILRHKLLTAFIIVILKMKIIIWRRISK